MKNNIIDLRIDLKDRLSPFRYEHSISVSFMCTALAMCYGCDLDRAELAGLLHDCAKCYGNDDIIIKCEKREIEITGEEQKAPAVLHAIYGSWLAKHKYNVDEPEVLEAIRCHTTGKPNMTMLDKIVFTADYIEPRRDRAPDLPFVRSLAFSDLDEAVYQILKDTLEYLDKKGSSVDSVSKQAYAYYKQVHMEKKGD